MSKIQGMAGNGALVILDPENPIPKVIKFQYNPESLSRSFQPVRPASAGAGENDVSETFRLTNPPNQSISDLSPDVQALPYINLISDFDGDGRTDLAIWRPNEGRWYLNNSIGYTQADWGLEGDRVVAGNYDGDDKTDFAVFRPSDGNWWVRRSSDNVVTVVQWGIGSDVIVQ